MVNLTNRNYLPCTVVKIWCFKDLGVTTLTFLGHVILSVTWPLGSQYRFPIGGQVLAGVPVCDSLCVYCSIIHSIFEYACPVWHPGLAKKLSKDTEWVQKLCLKLLYLSSNGFAAYISISASTQQSYSLWMRFCSVLRFQEVLNVLNA